MLAGSIANDKLANSTLTINGSSVSLGSSTNAGTLDWQTVIVADGSTGTTGVAGRGYFINTTSAAHTFTLPISATRGDTIAIVDYAQTFATNKLTIARNGHNIQGVANNSLIGTNRASVTLVYVDATKGWVYQDESNVADLQTYIIATGGTITTSGDFKIHSFTGDGCFVVTQSGSGSKGNIVDYLVIAGGGSGGNYYGGGGGAGGYRESKDTTINSPHTASPLAATSGLTITTTTYPVTVGAGATPATACTVTVGNAGSNSIFSTITSAGGAGGGRASSGGLPGGSGSGAGYGLTGGTGNTPPVSPPQGNNGGGGNSAPSYNAGGGGGAGAVGATAVSPTGNAGNGGVGLASSITGSPVTRAGGGGGGYGEDGAPFVGGTGGTGGGGNGASAPVGTGSAGSSNTGGGGGGSRGYNTPYNGGAGGKGIVIIRYQFQ
jgi:hypothetical protein